MTTLRSLLTAFVCSLTVAACGVRHEPVHEASAALAVGAPCSAPEECCGLVCDEQQNSDGSTFGRCGGTCAAEPEPEPPTDAVCSEPGVGWAGEDCVTDCDCCGLVCQKGTDRLGIYWSICNHCPAQGEEIDIPWP